MNKEKRALLFRKAKWYLNRRRKRFRFDVNHVLYRQKSLKEDVKQIERDGFQLCQATDSDIWIESYEKDETPIVHTATIGKFSVPRATRFIAEWK